ncbi:MAG: Ig-like domain-containing protein [Janthinobacterium lividum]
MIDTNLAATSNDFGIDDISLLGPTAVVPTATTVANSPAIVNTSGQTALTPGPSGKVSGTDNSIRTYTVYAPSTGGLYYNGTQLTTPTIIPAANIGLLLYQPVANATTAATFTYTVTDAYGNGSAAAATYTIPVIASNADVVTTLGASSATVVAGTSITYTTTIKNNGPTTATGIVPTVQLPAGLLLTLTGGASYNNTTGLVTLPTIASLTNGSTTTSAFTFSAPNYTATLAGTAASTSTSTDPTTTNNDGSPAAANASATVTLPVNGCAGAPYGSSASSGLYAEYYSGYFNGSTTYFTGKTPALTRTDGTINFPNNNSWGNLAPAPTGGTVDNPDGFSARYRGSINITTAGSYSFTLSSDDASLVWLDGAALAPTTANALATATYNTPQTKAITLSAGVHNLVIYYGENTGGNSLTLQYNGPDTGGSTVIVPNSVLCASMSQVPVASAVTNSPAIPSNNGQTAIAALSASDPDGQIDSYTILTLPANTTGILYYNNGTTTTAVTAGQIIPAANAGSLLFNPVVTYSGTATFTYAATDNSGELSNTATYSIPVTLAVADVTTTLSGPLQLGASQPGGPYTAVFTNNGPNSALQVTQVVTLPVGATMTAAQVTASGGTYTAGTTTTGGTLRFGTAPVALASGASNTYNFTITAPATTGTTYSMTSTVGTSTSQGSNSATDVATLTITVTPANRFVTYSDNNSLAANTKVTASVILNDDNPDATTAFTATVVAQPTHGAVALNAAGGYTYTPNPNYIGTDSFTYQICQTGTTPTCSNVSPVSLNVYDPNLVCTSGTGRNLLVNPSFTDGNTGFTSSYTYQTTTSTPAGNLYAEGTYGVGSNARDYHNNFTGTGRTGTGDNFMIVNGAANIQKVYSQTVTVQPNRYYTFSVYATSVNGTSPAQLGFVINNESTSVVTTLDGTTNYVKLSDVWFSGTSTSATFEIRDVNRAPTGNDFGLDDVYFGTCTKALLVNNITTPAVSKSSAAASIPALSGTASGGPALASFTIQTLPASGSGVLALNGTAVTVGQVIALADAGNLTFAPTASFTGSQAVFTYTATDSNGAGSDNTGTYTIPLDTPLVAVDDAVTTPFNTAVSVAVTANDRKGANGSAIDLTTIDLRPGVTGVQQGTAASPIAVNNGTAYVNAAGQVVFTPTTGFLGTALIPYTVKDASGILSNQATLMVQVVSQLDLATAITSPVTGATVTAGQSLNIAGTTANNSPAGTSASAVQQLQLPANLTGTPTFTRNGAPVTATYDKATGLVVFPALTLASGASATFGVTFIAPGTGPLTATASVNNSSPDVNLVDNVAAITLAVTPQFDLATTLTGPASVTSGTLAAYTVTTANNGPSPVAGAQQTVQLPTGLAGVYATNGGTYDSGSGVVTFPAQDLANGQVQTNSVSFSPTAGFSPSAVVTPNTNSAGDPATANNTAYLNGATSAAAVAVAAPATTDRANLYVTVTGPSQVAPSAAAAYTVMQGNNGPNAATGVQTQVSLPAGLGTTGFTVNTVAGTLSTDKATIAFGANGTYTVATGLLVLPALTASQASGATPQSYAINLTAPAAGPSLAVTASVRATTADLVPGNNVATAETEIRPLADLATSISRIEGGTATGTALAAGQQVTYSVQTVNNSANPAQSVLQTVDIPAGLPVASLQLNGLIGTLSSGVITFGSGATYNVASGLLTLPSATLAGNAVQTNALSFAVPASNTSLQAVATVSSPTADGTPANNTATVSNAVTALQDLSIALLGPVQAVQGNPVFYTVTATNRGASATGNQTTTVQLPTSLGAAGFLVNNVAGTLSSDQATITFGTSGPSYVVVTGLLTMPASAVGPLGTSTITTVQFLAPANIAQLDIAAVVVAPNESNLINNAAELSNLTVKSALGNSDLTTTIASSPTGTQAAGTTVTYTVTTGNPSSLAGALITNVAAQNVVQTVVLPTGLATATLKVNNTSGTYSTSTGLVAYNTSTGSTISYNPATGALVFPTVASLALGSTSVNTIAFPLPVNGPVVVTANSSGDNPDATPANNTVNSSTAVTSKATVAFGMSGPATTTTGNTVSYTLAATNNGPAAATDLSVAVTLPAGVTTYSLNGGASVTVAAGSTVTIYGGTGTTVPAGQSVTNVIAFAAPAGSFTVNGAVSNSNGLTTGTTTASGSVPTTQANALPIANDVVNTKQAPEGNTGSGMLLSAISGTDPDGSVTKYTIASLPTSAQGVLKLGTAAVTLNQTITLADVANLTFTPASTFVGNAFFTYTATDNGTTPLTSALATYTIPVAQDISASYALFNTGKGRTLDNKYVTGDNLAQVLDANTAAYAASATVFDATTGALQTGAANGLPTTTGSTNAVLASGTMPAGVTLDATTGRIYVSNASQLVNYGTAHTYALTITTTDLNGGTNTVPVNLTIGAFPLPVELLSFTATAVANRDAALAWATASEKNNDRFDVERSLDGTTFVKIGQVKGQGSTSSATNYAFTDASIGAKAAGAVYYRLRQVDADGTASLSPVRSVSFTKAAALAIGLYPNPAGASTRLDLGQLPAGTYQVSVVDMAGRSVLSASLAGAQLHTLDLAPLASGSYVVQVRGAAADGTAVSFTKRLVKE